MARVPMQTFAAMLAMYVKKNMEDVPRGAMLVRCISDDTMVAAVTTPLSGHISDRIGRKRMYLTGIATIGVFSFVYFALLNTAIPWVICFAIVVSFIPHDMAYGPQAALIAECFPARLRYSGSSLGFHLASIVAGGHCALSVMARTSRPPGTYWTQRASSAAATAVDIVVANMPNTTARVARCINFPKPFAILRADKHGALAHRNHNHDLARMLPNCRAPALPGEPRPNRD